MDFKTVLIVFIGLLIIAEGVVDDLLTSIFLSVINIILFITFILCYC